MNNEELLILHSFSKFLEVQLLYKKIHVYMQNKFQYNASQNNAIV